MVTKNKAGQKSGKVKLGKLKVNKETVKNLSPSDKKQIRGGRIPVPTGSEGVMTCGGANCLR